MKEIDQEEKDMEGSLLSLSPDDGVDLESVGNFRVFSFDSFGYR